MADPTEWRLPSQESALRQSQQVRPYWRGRVEAEKKPQLPHNHPQVVPATTDQRVEGVAVRTFQPIPP